MEKLPLFVAAFGNPLWDICVSLPDKSVLSKFDLADDSIQEVTAPEYESLLRAVQTYPVQECPGGAALNTLRVFQWLTANRYQSVFFGGIGDDITGRRIIDHISQAGVKGRLKLHKKYLTGSAVSLIYENTRTLVAHIGAANFYEPEDLTQEDKDIIQSVQLLYIENFFFCHSFAVIWIIVQLCKVHGVAIVLNLSGSYLFEQYAAEIKLLVSYANVVIGNENEFLTLAKSKGWRVKTDHEIVADLCEEGTEAPSSIEFGVKALKLTNLDDLKKVVVITRGHKPVLCGSEGKPIFETQVLEPKSGVKDTTGAGDAFVAGFLFGLTHGIPLNQCVQTGCYASVEIIQNIGCSPPENAPLALPDILKLQ